MMRESSSVPDGVSEHVPNEQETTSQEFSFQQSPALLARNAASPGAYELKCLMDEATALAVEEFLRRSMQIDPFAEAGLGQYRITTLSTDTKDLAVFRRQPGYAQRKLRIRRYGDEPRVYLEQKTRRGSKVRKHRTLSDPSELLRLSADHGDFAWTGEWFQSKIAQRQLQPVCLMTYDRRAWFGDSENGPIRLTFDRHLCGMLTNRWMLEHQPGLQPVVEGVICEFKFSVALPQLFKRAIEQFQLSPGGFSKYRNSMTTLTGLSFLTGESGEMPHA